MNQASQRIDLIPNDEERRTIQLDDEEEAHRRAGGQFFCGHNLRDRRKRLARSRGFSK
jgi:hypothetical protein